MHMCVFVCITRTDILDSHFPDVEIRDRSRNVQFSTFNNLTWLVAQRSIIAVSRKWKRVLCSVYGEEHGPYLH
jgi:hypothetical protein